MKKKCGYLHNGHPHRYGNEYMTDIYPMGRVRGNYYSYPTCSVDIPIFI